MLVLALLDQVADLATSSWAYLAVPAVIIADALVGVLPAELMLHVAGVSAARGHDSVWLLIAVAWPAAAAGDALTYAVGRGPGGWLRRRLERRDAVQRRIEWVRGELDERPWVLTIGRFVPGLRTTAMFAAGALRFPPRRFAAYVLPGDLLWAASNVLIGYFFGRVFERSPFWVPILVSAGVAGVLAGGLELARRVRERDAAPARPQRSGRSRSRSSA